MNAKNTPPRASKARLQASFATLAVTSAILLGASFLPSGNAQAVEEGGELQSSQQAVTPVATPFEMPPVKVGSSISSAVDMDALAECLDAKVREKDHALKVDLLIENALAKLGIPYSYGGTTPRGFDCSGFTGYVMKETFGIELPRTAAGQSALGTDVPMDALQKGDFLFWGGRSGVYHVGIYIGDGNYVHAGRSSASICVQSIGSYAPTFAKRIV